MLRILLPIALRLLACSAATYLAWRAIGLVGVVVCAPLFAVALARPILDLFGGSFRLTRALAWRDVDGRHFEHRGKAIDIVEDPAQQPWLRLSHVRRIITGLPSDQALARLYPQGVQALEASAPLRIRAEALAQYLEKATDPASLKFRLWLEREVAFPARQRRQRGPPSRLP